MADAGGGGVLRDGNGAFCGGSHAATAGVAVTATGAAATQVEAWKEWDDRATLVLLDLYTERYLALQRGTLRAKEWQEVVDGLNAQCAAGKPVYNYNRCKNKIDSLKKTFKTVREKRRLGTPVKWKWYNRIERITVKTAAGGGGADTKVVTAAAPLADKVPAPPDQFVDHHPEFDDGIGGSEDALVGLNGIQEELMMRSSFCSPPTLPPPPPPPPPRFGIPGQDQQQQQWSHQDHHHGKEASKKKRKRVVAPGSSSSPVEPQHHHQQHQMREVAQMMIDALERMEQRRQMLEEKRLEVLKELQQKRNETQWEIARLIVDARFFQQHATNPGDDNN
ncbi:uncharacterized protein LOC112348017 [Selaginella moellendorffii]|uniref:uncharacterized protein LOC112348017 n=1 Tax=Selaginella moellendorffii TaxID=88036 RepID=UPI000D1CCF5F|nr:uncharacterized protein LOC112348017 [Selaginella moellendorffii]|eukprot:XP_024535650.1 uncharacterized protein LOC112348017 [Selaginella moellendorffii]